MKPQQTILRPKLGLYLHLPFCERKCQYCDFNSYDNKRDRQADYIAALIRQMMDYAPFVEDYTVDTVYIGGGTPSCVAPKLLNLLLTAMNKAFHLAPDAEISCEANPHSAMGKVLKVLKKGGVNRLSFGFQSADALELQTLGRLHSLQDAKESFALARKLGFSNINLDVMFSIPGQTKESLLRTLSEVIALGPEHISAYSLQLEPGTPFYERRGELDLPDENTDRERYELVIDRLKAAGYEQYEISNFAKPGFRCRHNLRYWNCDSYIGLGCGAHSYFEGKRFSFLRDIDAYIAQVQSGGKLVDEMLDVPPNEMVGEYLMLRLRLTDGIDSGEFRRRFGFCFETAFERQIGRFCGSGHMKKEGTRYYLTTEGFHISNYIISAFVNDD